MSVFFTKRGEATPPWKYASDYAVGESIFLNVNGTETEFLVVHQGLPDATLYDESCNGTWLLMKDIFIESAWNNLDNNDYANSSVHKYLNGTFLGLFDETVRNTIAQVKIPYLNGNGSTGSIGSGENGLSCKVFLLSGQEVGRNSTVAKDCDGVCLDYFNKIAGADSKRIAYYKGNARGWYLRSPNQYTTSTCIVNTSGGFYISTTCISAYGFRPALILPPNTKFNPNTNVIL